jgi:ABC-type nickel/cobalt efflux system permease component RcnA
LYARGNPFPAWLRTAQVRDEMSFIRTSLALMALSLAAVAHPMGNFSVNHYARLHFGQTGVDLAYVLDLAEIPTFQLQGEWQGGSSKLAGRWVAKLALTENGIPVAWRIRSVTSKTTDGAGGMPVLRIVIAADAPLAGGRVVYRDLNFEGRAGWKEIVVDHAPDAVLHRSTQGADDLSKALTVYPTDPAVTRPQDLAATVDWSPAPSVPVTATVAPTPATTSFSSQQPSAPGSVVRGDFLSRMLQRKDIGWRLMLISVAAAFGLGSLHAMEPGHGKTIVAAYLVGSRGNLKHAGMLGLVVTFTHTFTVFLLGLGVLFFQQYVVPEKIIPALGAISGMSIVAVGVSLLYSRTQALLSGGHRHRHTHGGEFTHTHGGSTHSHAMEGEITPGGLIALGVGGGLVPCPSALILMLSAIALGRPGFGLVLLVAFSAGLALVLMTIGAMALYARNLMPDGRKAQRHPAIRLIPVFSSVVVIVLGLTITAAAAGWIRPMRFLS